MATEVGSISIKVTPDTKHFRQELKAQLEAIEKSMKAEIPAELDLDTSKAQAELNSLKAKDVKVKVDVDRSILDRLGQKLSNIKGPSFGTGVNPAGYLVAAAVALPLIAPVIGLITTAMLALPGLIALVATPIAALALGMEGLKKAAEVLKAPFDDLKSTMATKVQEQFTPVFEKLQDIFPTLKASMPAVTQGLADMAQSITDAVTSPEGAQKIENTIRNIGQALTDASPGIGSFTDGLISLAESLSNKFPSLTKWFNDTGASFEKWVTKMTSANWFTGTTPLEDAFGTLGDTVKGLLDTLGSLAEKGMEFFKDKESVQGFLDTLESIEGVLGRIVDLSNSFNGLRKHNETFDDINKLLMAGPAAPTEAIKQGAAGGWFDKITSAFSAEARAKQAPKFWEGLFDLNEVAKNLNPGIFGKTIFDFFKNTVGVGLPTAAAETGLQTGIQLGQKLGEGLGQATQVQSLAPQVESQVTAALVPLQAIPAQIQQAFSGVGAAVTGSMATVVSSVAGAGQQIVSAFTGSLSQIPGVAVQTFNAVAAAAAAGMANVVTQISTGAAQAVAAVTAMGTQIVAALQAAAAGARAAGAQVGAGMAAGIRESTGAAVAAARDLASAVSAASTTTLGIRSPSKVFFDHGVNVVQGLADGMASQKKIAADAARDIAAVVGNEFGKSSDLGGESVNKMIDIGKGFATANANQFMSDLGMSGNGAIPTLANIGLDWATGLLSKAVTGGMGGGTQIHVNSVDEALAARQNIVNKQALQYTKR